MSKYLIDGGIPLKGSVKIYGAKNSAFKLMLAASLSDEPSEIANICFIRNVYLVKELLEELGGNIGFGEKRTAIVRAHGLNKFEIANGFGKESRASSLVIPILLHRFKKAKVPLPGGDSIGQRSLDRHYEGLQALGAKVEVKNGFIEAVSPNGLKGAEYSFTKNTHTGTETLLLAACLAEGSTLLKNCANEPEVDDLINFLNAMGAQIKRKGNREIEIVGVKTLRGASYSVMPDQNEAVTFACAALATRGDVLVEEARKDHLEAFITKVKEAGGGVEIQPGGIRFFFEKELISTDVETKPFPGFKTDWQALWTTLMTQAKGESTIHETVFESRFAFVEFLKKMGAKIELFNPEVKNPDETYNFNLKDDSNNSFHAAKVFGPTKLTGTSLFVPDIRAGATLTLAAITASGQSSLENIEMIERGYESLEGRLQSLGAKIYKTD